MLDVGIAIMKNFAIWAFFSLLSTTASAQTLGYFKMRLDVHDKRKFTDIDALSNTLVLRHKK